MNCSDNSNFLKIVHYPELDKDKWREFVAANPHGTVFHTPEMYEVFLKTKGYIPYVCAACDRKDEIQALLTPVVVSIFENILKPLTSRALHFGGPVFSETPEGIEAIDFMLTRYVKLARKYALFSEFRNLTNIEPITAILKKIGFRYEPHLNYWQELDRPLDEIWSRMKPTARRAIRKAQKEGLVIEEMKDRTELVEWYRLLADTYRRKRMPLTDISLFENVFDILFPAGMARFFLGKVNDRIVGAYLTLLYKKVIYFWYSADDFEMRHCRPTDGFMDFLIRWGKENQYDHIDWGWAGREDEPYGVREFKAKYGGREIRFGRHVFVHKPVLLRMSKMGFNLIHGIRRKRSRDVQSEQQLADSTK